MGAYLYDNGQTDEGRAFVYHGSATGLGDAPANADWTAESDQANAQLRLVGGDGGGRERRRLRRRHRGRALPDNGQTDEGRAFVYHGSASGLSATANWTAESDQVNAYFGWSVGTAGDVNGDGYADVIVGAYFYDNGETDEGRAFVYYGNASDGLEIDPQQRRADDSVPVAPGGQSISPTQARLAALARTPFGRSQVRLQWEVKPEGTAFNGSGLGQSAWQEGGTAGYAFNSLVTGLSFERRYHWRVRIAGRPAGAATNSAVTYRSRWLYGGTFFTALSGQQTIGGTGQTNLLGQAAYVNVTTLGTLTGLTLRGYPQTAHWGEVIHGEAGLILDRYFTLTPNGGPSDFDLTLCLNYDDAELGAVPETDLLLCHWWSAGSDYVCRPRSTASSTTLNLACADGVTGLSDWVVAGLEPTAVRLARFEAWPAGDAIHVEWETVTEVDTLGFNLYRSESANGEYAQLNEAMIPGQAPGSPGGAVYGWEDADVQAGITYYYRLEAVDVWGQGQLFGPVQATAGVWQRVYLPVVTR